MISKHAEWTILDRQKIQTYTVEHSTAMIPGRKSRTMRTNIHASACTSGHLPKFAYR